MPEETTRIIPSVTQMVSTFETSTSTNSLNVTEYISKTIKTTPSLQFYSTAPEKRQTESVPSTPKKTTTRKISNAPPKTTTTIGFPSNDSFSVTEFNHASVMNQMNGFKLFGMILFGIIFA